MVRSVRQLRIDLIGEHINILFNADLCNLLQILPPHHTAGRIVRKRHYENLRLICNRRQKLFLRQAELIFLFQFNCHRYAVCQHDTWHIGNVARLRNEHLIARIQHRTKCHINSFAAAYRYKNLMKRIIGYLKSASEILCDRHTQFLQTGIGRIKGPSLFQCINTLITNMPRRIKIRLTDTK